MRSVAKERIGWRTSLEVEWEGDDAFARIADGTFCRETQRVPRGELATTLRRLADAVDGDVAHRT